MTHKNRVLQVAAIISIFLSINLFQGCAAEQAQDTIYYMRVLNDLTLGSKAIEEKLEKINARVDNIPKKKRLELEDWLYIFGLSGGAVAGGIKLHGSMRNRSAPRRVEKTLNKIGIDVVKLKSLTSKKKHLEE